MERRWKWFSTRISLVSLTLKIQHMRCGNVNSLFSSAEENSSAHMIIVSIAVECWTPVVSQSRLRRSIRCMENVLHMSRPSYRHHCSHIRVTAQPTLRRFQICHWNMSPTSRMPSAEISIMQRPPRHRRHRQSSRQHRWWTRIWSIHIQLTSHTVATWRMAVAMQSAVHTMPSIIIIRTRCRIQLRWIAMAQHHDRRRVTRRRRSSRRNICRVMRSVQGPCIFPFM